MPKPRKLYAHMDETLTLEQWSKKLGIPMGTLRERLGKKLPLDKVFKPGKRTKPAKKTLEYNGFRLTIAEWAQRTQALGISEATLRMRLSRGWSPERALTEPINPPLEKWIEEEEDDGEDASDS